MNKKKIFMNVLKAIVTIILIAWVINKVGISQLFDLIKKVDFLTIVWVFLLLILMLITGAACIFVLFRAMNQKISFSKLLNAYGAAWGASNFLPGKAGDLMLLPLLKKEKIGYGHSLAIFMIDKIITLVSLSILSLIAIFLLLEFNTFLWILFVIIALLLVLLFVLYSKFTRGIIKKFILRKYSKKFKGFYKTTSFLMRGKKRYVLLNFILTFIKWFLASYAINLILISVGAKSSILYVYLVTSAITLLSMIPISINGLGVREYFATILYPKIGISPTQIVSVYLILIARTYAAALALLVYSMFHRKK